jgi:hypothetical protein
MRCALVVDDDRMLTLRELILHGPPAEPIDVGV